MKKDTGIRMTLLTAREWTDAEGRLHRREEWTIAGGEIDPRWRSDPRTRAAGWEPTSRFTLYVVDDEVDPRLASYGGVVWPTAWPELFAPLRQAGVEITDLGLQFRAAALHGASSADADVRLQP